MRHTFGGHQIIGIQRDRDARGSIGFFLAKLPQQAQV